MLERTKMSKVVFYLTLENNGISTGKKERTEIEKSMEHFNNLEMQ